MNKEEIQELRVDLVIAERDLKEAIKSKATTHNDIFFLKTKYERLQRKLKQEKHETN